MKRKIVVTTGTRAEYGLLRLLLNEIKSSKKLELNLIVAGMHLSKKHGNTIKEIRNDGFQIYDKVKMIPTGNSPYDMSKTLGLGILKFSKIFHKLKPEINVILGDRDESFASAIAAFHMNIPNAHIHGGDKSQAGIDEYIRHAITKISNIHFTASKKSTERVKKMGENPKYVFYTGSPGIDEVVQKKFSSKKELELKYNIKFSGQEILLLQHPITTQSERSRKEIQETLNAIKQIKKTTIAILPNSDSGHKEIFSAMKIFSRKYEFFKVFPSIPRNDYLGFLNNCGVLVGNSSSGVVEGSYFNIPIINIGSRQKGRERGNNVIDVDYSEKKIHDMICQALSSKKSKFVNNYVYGKGNASKKIVKHLETIILNKKLIEKQIIY